MNIDPIHPSIQSENFQGDSQARHLRLHWLTDLRGTYYQVFES